VIAPTVATSDDDVEVVNVSPFSLDLFSLPLSPPPLSPLVRFLAAKTETEKESALQHRRRGGAHECRCNILAFAARRRPSRWTAAESPRCRGGITAPLLRPMRRRPRRRWERGGSDSRACTSRNLSLLPAAWTRPWTMEDYKFLFKVVLVGNAGVGKTCLVRRFTQVRLPDVCRFPAINFPLDSLWKCVRTTATDAFANSCTSSRADRRVPRKDRKLVIRALCADDVIYVYVEFRTGLVFVSPYIAASAFKRIAWHTEALINMVVVFTCQSVLKIVLQMEFIYWILRIHHAL